MQRNTLQLTYPARMDHIPISRFGEAHLLEISELKLPQEGFFTLRMIAQYLVPWLLRKPPKGPRSKESGLCSHGMTRQIGPVDVQLALSS
eukprot:symbB.v1.2.009955.t1/scaffold559.1/size321893/10